MAKRTSAEQSIHDLVVRRSAAAYRDRGGIAYANPSTEKNRDVYGLYPDVVAIEYTGSRVIEEIETASTVTEDEYKRQWTPYAKLGYLFRLVVPSGKEGLAQGLVRQAQLSVELQTYSVNGGDVAFYDLQGNRIA
jgi:hypothetical protein